MAKTVSPAASNSRRAAAAEASGTHTTMPIPQLKVRYISWGAAGWHLCFDVLDRHLAGEPIGRMVGPEVMNFEGWQRLTAEYKKQFEQE